MSRKDPYRLLGVSRDASFEEVRAAFRKKVRQQHPDTATEERDDSDVQDVIEAYRLLMNRASRAGRDSETSRASRGRRIHVKRGSRSRHEPEQGEASCQRCGGAGMERVEMVCPDCDGRAEITALGEFSARIVRCRRCRGEGRLRTWTTCRVCGGSGAAAG